MTAVNNPFAAMTSPAASAAAPAQAPAPEAAPAPEPVAAEPVAAETPAPEAAPAPEPAKAPAKKTARKTAAKKVAAPAPVSDESLAAQVSQMIAAQSALNSPGDVLVLVSEIEQVVTESRERIEAFLLSMLSDGDYGTFKIGGGVVTVKA